MRRKKKSSSKSVRAEKRVDKVFERRAEILRSFGFTADAPKPPHYILTTKR